jgi:N-carbamoylputrescine amidase
MVGHAVSNLIPVVAANRVGIEGGQSFYGHSFVCDHFGDVLAELPDARDGVIVQELDLEEAAMRRAAFGFFRDRRPDLYGRLVRDE